MKVRSYLLSAIFSILSAHAAMAAPYLAIFGSDAENRVYHFYIDESAGETNLMTFEFWPNDGTPTMAEIFTTLNRRDQATLNPADPNTVVAGDTNGYWGAYSMSDAGGGKYTLTLPIKKCGSYDIRARYKVSGDSNWRWYAGRNPVANISDVETRDLVVYEMQANVVDATGNDYASRSTFASLTNTTKNWNVDYISSLGVNTIWLQPFHPIGAKSDCNSGDPGSPYSIKNLFQVAEHLGSDGTRATAMKEFTNFVISARAKGVKVICDVIFNHVATDIEIERDPDNPANLYSTPSAEMRNVKYQWFSKYTGSHSDCATTKPQSDWANYHYTEPAANSSQIGPAPADRNDFVWPDAFDLFWGTYSALGNINDTSDGAWTASSDVKKMVEYYAYFIQYWLEKTGGTIGGFRCDFAQGLPRQAWQYLVNRAKSLRPELYFVSESLDGGNIAYRAWKGGFDALNENELWAIVEDTDITATDLRNVIDQRKTTFGLALILRGTMNHDQGPWLGRKWDAVAMHSVFCAIDGTPQLYEGQELGYDALGQFSRERVEFGRTIPDIRNYHNMNNLWNNRSSGDNPALWYRYKDANMGRSRSVALRVANQYYLDRTGGQGPHSKIFSVLKYTQYGWDPKDQEVVLAFVNLQPGTANSATFNINVPAIYLNPTRTYNVRNLASSTPGTYLWAQGRSGSDLAANGIYVGFSADKGQEGAIAQYLKLEEQGGSGTPTNLTWIGGTYHWPTNGAITAADDLWVNIESYPKTAASGGSVVYSVDNVNWTTVALSSDGQTASNDKWHANLGKFAAGASVRYAVQVVQQGGTNFWDNRGGSNYIATVNNGGNGQRLQWIGTVTHWPTNGAITSADDFWVDIQSWPTGAAANGFVVFSYDNGTTWPVVDLSLNHTSPSNDFWHANLGKFAAGATIQFAVSLSDNSRTNQQWANNGGSNYVAVVNGASSNRSVQWVGNAVNAGLVRPSVANIDLAGDGLRLAVDAARPGGLYQVYSATNLFGGWTFVTNIVAGGSDFLYTNSPSGDPCVFFKTIGQSIPLQSTVFEGDELIIRAESWPLGRAVSANIVYSSNGQNWSAKPMGWVGTNGNNDVWEANLGSFPKGISVQYAVEILDDQGFSLWDNNNSQNHQVSIYDPNQPDVTPPVLSHSPSNTTTASSSLDVTLTAVDDFDPSPKIYYTTNGSTPTASSTLYSAPVHVTANLTIKAIGVDSANNTSAVKSVDVRVNESFTFGSFKPYSVNPTFGHAVANGGITIDGSPADWTTNMLVALDVADDDPRTLGDNWTTHEAPIDFAYLWAAWDDNYLYLAWQYVDLTDLIDSPNAGSAAGGKISSNDGILQWIAIDTIQGAGAAKDVWSKNGGQPYWSGADLPDYQIYMAGSLWQGYISRAVNGVFALDDGGVNYKTAAAAGISYAKGNTLGSGTLWMPSSNHADGRYGALSVATHDTTRDSFYEIRIPLSFLQITRTQLEANGLGVMMGAGSASCMDSIPHDETTLDAQGVEVWNSSKEWTDTDHFTNSFARVGHQK